MESFKTTDTAQIEEPEEPVVNPTQVTTVAPQEPSPIYPRPPTMSEYGELSHATEQTGLDESEEIMAKRPEPTQAMSALASVMMRSGQRKSVHVPDSVDVESADDGISGSPSKVSVKSHSSSPAQQHPPESLSASSVKPAPAPRPRPAAPKTDGERNSADMSETQNPEPKATPPLAAKPSPPKKPFKHEQALAETVDTQQPPVPVPRPRPVVATRPNSDGAALVGSQRSPVSMETRRPMSMALEGSMADSGLPIAMYSPTRPDAPEIPATAPVPQPRRIPGVFSTQHGAIGALAAAVTGRKTSPASSPASEGLPSLEAIESSGLREPLGHDDEAADNQDDTVERAAELVRLLHFTNELTQKINSRRLV